MLTYMYPSMLHVLQFYCRMYSSASGLEDSESSETCHSDSATDKSNSCPGLVATVMDVTTEEYEAILGAAAYATCPAESSLGRRMLAGDINVGACFISLDQSLHA